MIDWERIQELQAEIGAEAFDELAVIFLEEVDEAVLALSRDGNDDPAVQMERFHFLKGAALNLGFAVLADLCAIAEEQAALGEATGDLAGEVATSYTQSRQDFLRYMAQRGAAPSDGAI